MTLTPGLRRYVLWMAHLALVIYVAQIVAIDHWHADPADAFGVPGSNAHHLVHVSHCHGASSGCADGGGMTPSLLSNALTPLPPEPHLYREAPAIVAPANAFLGTPIEPPQAA